jgi:hypothetical protein
MASSELREELKELRAEMEAQKAASREKATGRKASNRKMSETKTGDVETPVEEQIAAATEQSTHATVAASGGDEGGSGTATADLAAQLRELSEKFDSELKDTHPAVLIGVFAAGVLIGRLLSR